MNNQNKNSLANDLSKKIGYVGAGLGVGVASLISVQGIRTGLWRRPISSSTITLSVCTTLGFWAGKKSGFLAGKLHERLAAPHAPEEDLLWQLNKD